MINAIFSIPIIQRLQREDYRPILRIVVILGVIILAAAASFASSQMLSIILIGLPIAIGIVFLFLRYPALGIIAIIPASFIIPFEIGVSSGSSLNAPMLIIILMTGLWLFDMVAIKRQI